MKCLNKEKNIRNWWGSKE